MIKKLFNSSFVRYIIVGVGSLVVDYGLLLFGYHVLNLDLAVATTAGFIAGMLANFLLNKFWAFGDTGHTAKRSALQMTMYVGLVIFNLLFTNVFVIFLQNNNVGPEVSKIASTAMITLWNFIIYKKIIFKKRTLETEPTTPLS